MSSFIRNLQRKATRRRADYEPRPQPTVLLDNGGYAVLHPTRGWRVFTADRLARIQATANRLALNGARV